MGPFQRIAERWQERRQERRERWMHCPPRQALQELRQEVNQNEEENEDVQKRRKAEEVELEKREGKREFAYEKNGEWNLHSLFCEPNRRVTVWYETAQGIKQRYDLGMYEGERFELRGSDLSIQRHGRSFLRDGEPPQDTDFVTIGAKGAFEGTELHMQIEGLPERTIVVGKGEGVAEKKAETLTPAEREKRIAEVREALSKFQNDSALLEKFKSEHGGRDPTTLLQAVLDGARLNEELQKQLEEILPSSKNRSSP